MENQYVLHIYSECVFVALVTHHAMRVHHTVVRVLSSSTIFSHTVLQTVRFSGENPVTEHKIRVFSTRLLSETFLILLTTE